MHESDYKEKFEYLIIINNRGGTTDHNIIRDLGNIKLIPYMIGLTYQNCN